MIAVRSTPERGGSIAALGCGIRRNHGQDAHATSAGGTRVKNDVEQMELG